MGMMNFEANISLAICSLSSIAIDRLTFTTYSESILSILSNFSNSFYEVEHTMFKIHCKVFTVALETSPLSFLMLYELVWVYSLQKQPGFQHFVYWAFC